MPIADPFLLLTRLQLIILPKTRTTNPNATQTLPPTHTPQHPAEEEYHYII